MSLGRLTLLIPLAFVLTACPLDLIDVPAQGGPDIELSVTNAEVGEEVQATLSVYYVGAPHDTILENVWLGACFYDSEYDPSGACPGERQPLATRITVLNGTSFEKELGDLVIRAGQTINFSHTFAFTAGQKEDFLVNPAIGFEDPNGQITYELGNPGIPIMFE